jgi:hypothetical protein
MHLREAVFCEGVQYRLRFFLDYLNCVKMTAFKFYLESGKPSCKSQLFCNQNSGRNLYTFSRSRLKASQQYSKTTAWPARANFLWTIPLISKKSDEHALDFAFHLSRLFRSRWFWTFRVQLMLSSPNACLIISRISVALSPRFAQRLMHTRCRTRR